MPKLTDTQLVILAAAAQREDGAVLPLPTSLKLVGGALTSVLKSILKKDLVAEQPAVADATAWRKAEDGQRMMLVITHAGRQAIGVEVEQGTDEPKTKAKSKANKRQPAKTGKPARETQTPKPAATSARPGSKQGLLVDLLSRRRGATITEAVEATGWQAHSVRGAISGTLKKKLGLTLTSEKRDGRGRVYRIAGKA